MRVSRDTNQAASSGEAGCTPHEIGAILGHRTLSEMQKYTEIAGQELMADRAMERLRSAPKKNARD